jgi:hypothetical protein
MLYIEIIYLIFQHLFCFVAATSVAILLFNKNILSSYKFHFSTFMTLAHMLVCLLMLFILKTFKLINYSSFDIHLAKKALPLSLCFVANIIIGMTALRMTNIPMFT